MKQRSVLEETLIGLAAGGLLANASPWFMPYSILAGAVAGWSHAQAVRGRVVLGAAACLLGGLLLGYLSLAAFGLPYILDPRSWSPQGVPFTVAEALFLLLTGCAWLAGQVYRSLRRR